MKYKVNFKALSTKQKMEYIWDYYRWHIVVIIVGIIISLTSIYRIVIHNEPLLSVIMLNSYDSTLSSNSSGFDDFFRKYNYETFDGALELNNNLHFYGEDESTYEDYKTSEILFALLQSGEFELFFGTGDLYLEFLNQGCFADMSLMLSQDLLKEYEEQIIYSDNMGTCEKYPAAFVLKENLWLSENEYYNDTCYVGILKMTDNPDIAAEFVEYLLNY